MHTCNTIDFVDFTAAAPRSNRNLVQSLDFTDRLSIYTAIISSLTINTLLINSRLLKISTCYIKIELAIAHLIHLVDRPPLSWREERKGCVIKFKMDSAGVMFSLYIALIYALKTMLRTSIS